MLEHAGLIYKVLKRYKDAANTFSSVDHEDLVQEAWAVIARKIDGHDPEKGAMSTYLYPWIVDSMQKYINKRPLMRQEYDVGRVSIEFEEFKAIKHSSAEDVIIGMQEAERIVKEYLKGLERSDSPDYRPPARRNKYYKEIKALIS